MIGLKHNQNRLVDYDPEWPALFEQERDRLQSVLLGIPRGIEHYGSTAVSGLRAKPIVEILIRGALRASRNLREGYLIAKEAASKLAPEGRAKYNELKQIFFDRVDLENLVKWDVVSEDLF